VSAATEGTAKKRRALSRRRRPVLAAIDLGTNNCRLLVAVAGRKGDFRVVDSFSRIVRLGEGVAETGLLSDDAISRTVATLKICSERLAKMRATHVRAIATEACRQARNASVLVARAKAEAGIDIEIISAEEEARLAAIGCAPLIGTKSEGALVFDIGGGSTEIIWMRREGPEAKTMFATSVPVGVVGLAERNLPTDRAGFAAMRGAMIARFSPVRTAMDAQGAFSSDANHLLGTSGTVTTLAGIAMGLKRYVRAKVDTSWHACETILGVVDRLAALDLEGRAALGCVGAERADLIVPGCAIFSAIHALWPCPHLRVADRGLREGMLRELALQGLR
jgi:exopolyphosphatase/guanosine-5'-triphosphate,3'-diphosphate pyrophosphatase